MTTFPNSLRLLKGGIVLVDPESGAVQRTIVRQYNSDTFSRTLQARSAVAEAGDRSEELRLTGPPIETSPWMRRSTPLTSWSFPIETRRSRGTASNPCFPGDRAVPGAPSDPGEPRPRTERHL